MTTSSFLWLIFGGWAVLLAAAAIAQLKRPEATSFGPPMLILGLVTGSVTLGKAGIGWAAGVAAMAVIGYFALNQLARFSLRRR